MVVKMQAWEDLQSQLTINGIELFKIYRKGSIPNPSQYHQINDSDRVCYVAYNAEYKKYHLYSSPALVISKLRDSYKHADKEFIIPVNNQYYYMSCSRTEILLPKVMYFKSTFLGELDDELEIVLYKNLMASQFERECIKRGVEV